jgi:hypothetical protein
MVIFGTRVVPEAASEGKTGIYYFPVTNESGVGHRLCFCALPGEAGAQPINLAPTEEPRLYAELDPSILRLDKNLVLQRTDEQALSDKWYPVLMEMSRSVTQLTKFLPLGLRRYSRMVRDKADPNPVKPLDLIKTMMIGWEPLYQANSAIYTGVSSPSYLDEFSDFEVVPGRGLG